MSSTQNAIPQGRCYECFRPEALCFCDSIPSINNQTDVLILQHRRERFHPFNTARIVHKALGKSRLLTDHTNSLAQRLQLQPSAALLYPGPASLSLADLAIGQRPEQLVVLDGTWHHAKTLIREIPALQRLPRFRLAPTTPSRYRIRREPNVTALSTVEAVVAALRILEPETAGLDCLLQAFDAMVEGQLSHPGSENGERFKTRRNRTYKNIPLALAGELANFVVAYGESAAGERGQRRPPGPPVVWVAQRLGSGETFCCTLAPPRPLDDVFLGHLQLTRADFSTALSLDEARLRWAQFQRPEDVVAVLHPGTVRLLSYLSNHADDCLVLKSVDLDLSFHQPTLAGLSPAPQLPPASLPTWGRAGQRLGQTIALVRQFQALAKAQARGCEPLAG